MKKKLIILLLIIIMLIFLLNTSLARYIYNGINNHILESHDFYFQSSILTPTGGNYSISNWDGVNSYQLNFELTSKKNDFVYTTTDIKYDISYNCPDTVICTLSKNQGIISKISKVDSYTLTVTPINNFYEGDTVLVSTSVTSTYPYTKTLSASYLIGVENYGFSYDIKDNVGDKYLILELTNSKPYYSVVTAFNDYNVGDHVSLDEYNNLSEIDKQKCISHTVTVNFNPNTVLLDLTNSTYLKSYNIRTTSIGGYEYINSITFDVLANSNEKVQFYKVVPNNQYNITNSGISVVVN